MRSALAPLLLPLLLMAGCGEPWRDAELHGIWVNRTDGEIRALHFEKEGTGSVAGVESAFHLYYYLPSMDPLELNAGTYTIEDGGLYQHVTVWRDEPSNVEYWNAILELTDTALTVESEDGINGRRVYSAADELP